ncbi:MAG: hypothetical protein NW220_01460 [Leptolyngbyaceae cyanobacterium bins.349]|nr:hypothetical protein [Leptolyngbyaceae cyanobacterium bins.349]
MTMTPPAADSSSSDGLLTQTHPLLISARAKLTSPHLPHFLRIVAFLGTSCQAMADPDAYTTLMQELCQYQGWWKTCEATPAGTLKSSHPDINHLLEPINRLHRPHDQ